MLDGIGRIKQSGRSIVVRLPKELAVDSAFPFKINQEVTVQIVKEQNSLIVKPLS